MTPVLFGRLSQSRAPNLSWSGSCKGRDPCKGPGTMRNFEYNKEAYTLHSVLRQNAERCGGLPKHWAKIRDPMVTATTC